LFKEANIEAVMLWVTLVQETWLVWMASRWKQRCDNVMAAGHMHGTADVCTARRMRSQAYAHIPARA